jgi:hypothetical protein
MKFVFMQDYYSFGNPDVIDEYYLDTVIINGYKYLHVNKPILRENTWVGAGFKDTTYQLLINRYNGVLLFKNDNTNEYYTLIQKP